MGKLATEDRKLIQELRENDVLLNVAGRKLDCASGAVVVTCADGDQFDDCFRFQAAIVEEQCGIPRVHIFSLNGGALRIPKHSPLGTSGEGTILIEDMRGAEKLKGMTTVILYAHAPCGAAGLANLGVREVIELLVAAKARLKEELSHFKIACFCHIDWGDGKKRTYFFSRDAWERWSRASGEPQENLITTHA